MTRRATAWAPLPARLRYRFDNAMARGPLIVVAYLALLSAAIVSLSAVIAVGARIVFAGGASDSLPEQVWQAMLRTLDSGTFAADTAWPTRLLALFITLCGIFLAGSLIGLIASAVDQKVEELRRGRSPVVEANHTLILGWSDQVPRIVAELVVANESQKDASIVILSPEEKSLMEDTLRALVPRRRTTRIVCRSGSPASPDDLARVAAEHARAVVAVRGDDGDAGVVKAVLAVRALDPDLANAHVVAEVAEVDNAAILREVTAGRVVTVSSDDIVAEITAQASLQAGLASVFSDLLDFDGDEIYFTAADGLAGRTYREAALAFEHCSVIGRKRGATVELNPGAATEIAAGDELVVIAEDDSTIAITALPAPIPTQSVIEPHPLDRRPMTVALIGWSTFGAKVLKELDEFLAPGSTVHVVVDRDLADPAGIPTGARNSSVRVLAGSGGPGDLRRLSEEGRIDQVIVLGYRDALSVDDADARTLLTLLGLRMIWPVGGGHGVRIVAELLDQRNLALAAPVGVDDLIVSNALSSLVMAQLAERAELQTVFADLFSADGATVEMRPATSLVSAGNHRWGDVVAVAAAGGMSAFGYRVAATRAVVMNPAKSDEVSLGGDDHVAVVATAAPSRVA